MPQNNDNPDHEEPEYDKPEKQELQEQELQEREPYQVEPHQDEPHQDEPSVKLCDKAGPTIEDDVAYIDDIKALPKPDQRILVLIR